MGSDVFDHPEWAQWVRRIRQRPGDDLPRLQAADWLQEHGEDDYAEFVRVQVELAVTKWDGVRFWRKQCFGPPAAEEKAHFKAYDDIQQRAALLSTAVITPRRMGGSDVLRRCGVTGLTATFARGFVESVAGPADVWVANGDTILRRQPVTRVELTTWPVVGPVADGWQLVGDDADFRVPFQDAVEASWKTGESITHAACRARWPGVEFAMPDITADYAEVDFAPLFIPPAES